MLAILYLWEIGGASLGTRHQNGTEIVRTFESQHNKDLYQRIESGGGDMESPLDALAQ
jgi:hypothetical protein